MIFMIKFTLISLSKSAFSASENVGSVLKRPGIPIHLYGSGHHMFRETSSVKVYTLITP